MPETKEKQLKAQKLTHTPTHDKQLPPCDDKRLGFVIARWQALPEHVREAIAMLVKAG